MAHPSHGAKQQPSELLETHATLRAGIDHLLPKDCGGSFIDIVALWESDSKYQVPGERWKRGDPQGLAALWKRNVRLRGFYFHQPPEK
jgi:hypothetical protein